MYWDHIDCNPPGFSVHRISQARILEWVATPFAKVSSQPRDWTCVSCLVGRLLKADPPGKPHNCDNWHLKFCYNFPINKYRPSAFFVVYFLFFIYVDLDLLVIFLSFVVCEVVVLFYWRCYYKCAKDWVAYKEWKSLSCVQFFGIPWTIQSNEFSSLEYWSV